MHPSRANLGGLCRREPFCCLAVLALLPVLLLSPFTGRTLVAHLHEGHGAHFHALETGERSAAAVRQVKQDCPAVRACHEPRHEHDPASAPEDDSDGVTVPSFEPVRWRGVELTAGPAGSWPCSPGWTDVRPDLGRVALAGAIQEAARRGQPPGAGLWRAQERLVRTSQALLI